MLTLAQLRIVLVPVPKTTRVDEVYPFFAAAFARWGVNTPTREAYFLAQAAHESDRFCALTEYASGAAYEGRVDLGNTELGDGKRFKGRGLFQITGRANYGRCSRALFGDERLFDKPELLAEPQYAVESACWYWNWRHLDGYADRNDFAGCTRRINGGTNGCEQRELFFNRIKRLM
jgi:putative chitinase